MVGRELIRPPTGTGAGVTRCRPGMFWSNHKSRQAGGKQWNPKRRSLHLCTPGHTAHGALPVLAKPCIAISDNGVVSGEAVLLLTVLTFSCDTRVVFDTSAPLDDLPQRQREPQRNFRYSTLKNRFFCSENCFLKILFFAPARSYGHL